MNTHLEPAQVTIERLLRRIDRLILPPEWLTLTPQELHLDSLDWVELQLELESAYNLTLFDDAVTQSPLTELTFGALASHIDGLCSGKRGQSCM